METSDVFYVSIRENLHGIGFECWPFEFSCVESLRGKVLIEFMMDK